MAPVGEEEPLRLLEGVMRADPDVVLVTDCVVEGDTVPDPVRSWEGLEEGVREPLLEPVAKELSV